MIAFVPLAGHLNRHFHPCGTARSQYYTATAAGAEALEAAKPRLRELVTEVLEGEGPERLPGPPDVGEPAAPREDE